LRRYFLEAITKTACNLATRHPVPERYTLGNENNDFAFLSIYEGEEANSEFLVKKIRSDKGFEGIFWPEGVTPGIEACLPWTLVKNPRFKINRVFGRFSIEFSSPAVFILHELLCVRYFYRLASKASFLFFKSRFRFSRERMWILSKIVDWQRDRMGDGIQNTGEINSFSHIDLYTYLYGLNAWRLDEREKYLAELKFILQSFTDSGEIIEINHNFQLRGKALETLSKYEENARRHADSKKQSNRIFWLTLVIAIAGLGQLVWNFIDRSV